MISTERARATVVSPSQLPSTASSAVLVISAEIRIAALPEVCLALTRSVTGWPSWNSFVAKVDVAQSSKSAGASNMQQLMKGTNFTMHVRMDASNHDSLTETKLVVKACSEKEDGGPLAITWNTAGMSRFALRTERTNEFHAESWEESEGSQKKLVKGCRYRTAEIMNGPLAYVVKSMYGARLQEVFETWAEDLAMAAEATEPEVMK